MNNVTQIDTVNNSATNTAALNNLVWPTSSNLTYPNYNSISIRSVANGFILNYAGSEYVFSTPADLTKELGNLLKEMKKVK